MLVNRFGSEEEYDVGEVLRDAEQSMVVVA